MAVDHFDRNFDQISVIPVLACIFFFTKHGLILHKKIWTELPLFLTVFFFHFKNFSKKLLTLAVRHFESLFWRLFVEVFYNQHTYGMRKYYAESVKFVCQLWNTIRERYKVWLSAILNRKLTYSTPFKWRPAYFSKF